VASTTTRPGTTGALIGALKRREQVVGVGFQPSADHSQTTDLTESYSEDWKLQDPASQPVEVVRRIRDDIDGRVRRLLAELVPTGA
jgi:protein-tyrosine-phosphatase